MKISLLLAVLLMPFQLPGQSPAAEFKLVHRHGEPVADDEAAWGKRIEFASWVDENSFVFASHSGDIVCKSLDNGKVKWTLENVDDIEDWSLSRTTKRLAYLGRSNNISVVDCTNGKSLLKVGPAELARLLHADFAFPTRLAIAPNDGRLIVGYFSTYYGRNAYVLDASYQNVLSTFHVDAAPKELSLSPTGERVAVIADKEVLCVREITADREVFFRGERIAKKPESFSFEIDAPFFSHLRDGGGDTIVYTLDNSWATGKAFVHNIKTNSVKEFDARNGHIEMDVAFPARRIVLTGTSTDLTLVDFDGKELAHLKNATKGRNSRVEFSPSGQQILVGSWDNSVSIFRIIE